MSKTKIPASMPENVRAKLASMSDSMRAAAIDYYERNDAEEIRLAKRDKAETRTVPAPQKPKSSALLSPYIARRKLPQPSQPRMSYSDTLYQRTMNNDVPSPTSPTIASADTKIYKGQEAVEEYQKAHPGAKLTDGMKKLIVEEGYATGPYKDDKGNITTGVGQTNDAALKPFHQVYYEYRDQARNMTKGFDELPEKAQNAIVSATYRGDWGQSPAARKLFNAGKYKEAAKEFLNHDEYKRRSKKWRKDGVVKRMEHIASVIESLEKKA